MAQLLTQWHYEHSLRSDKMTTAQYIISLRLSSENAFKECIKQVSIEDFLTEDSSLFTFTDNSMLYQYKGMFVVTE